MATAPRNVTNDNYKQSNSFYLINEHPDLRFRVHYHKEKYLIRSGKKVEDNGLNETAIIARLNQSRDETKALMFNAYKEAYKNNISVNTDVETLLEYSNIYEEFKNGLDLAKIDEILTQQFQEQFKKNFDPDFVARAFHTFNVESLSSEFFKNGKFVRKEGLQNLMTSVEELGKMLNLDLSNLVQFVNNEEITLSKRNSKGYKVLYDKIQDMLNKYNGKTMQLPGAAQQKAFLKQLKNSIKLIQGGVIVSRKNKNKAVINQESIAASLGKNLLSKEFFEGAAAIAASKAIRAVDTVIGTGVESSGSKSHKIGEGSPFYLNTIEDSRRTTGGITYKADVTVKNLKVEVIADEKDGVVMTVNVPNAGISVKNYLTLQQGKSNLIDAGSGGLYIDLIRQAYANDYQQYLATNVLVRAADEGYKNAVKQVHAQLVRTSFAQIFVSQGKEDFNNFLVVNGQLYSLYSIYNYILNLSDNEIGGSNTTNGGGLVSTSISGRDKWYKANKYGVTQNFLDRQRKINAVLNNSVVTGNIHVGKLSAALESGKIY
jgi:hypothetical protein